MGEISSKNDNMNKRMGHISCHEAAPPTLPFFNILTIYRPHIEGYLS